MQANTMTHGFWERKSPWTAIWRKVLTPGRLDAKPQDDRHQTMADLARLAETSPHLLADAGLVADKPVDGSTVQVWRCPEMGFEVVIADDGEVHATIADTISP